MLTSADLEAVRAIVRGELLLLVQQRLTPPQQRALLALRAVFSEPFTSNEVCEGLDLQIASRRELRAALLVLCRGAVPTPQRIGHALRALADAGGAVSGLRLVDAGKEAGSRLWGIEGAAFR